jgi:hypothetical protein
VLSPPSTSASTRRSAAIKSIMLTPFTTYWLYN